VCWRAELVSVDEAERRLAWDRTDRLRHANLHHSRWMLAFLHEENAFVGGKTYRRCIRVSRIMNYTVFHRRILLNYGYITSSDISTDLQNYFIAQIELNFKQWLYDISCRTLEGIVLHYFVKRKNPKWSFFTQDLL
jgi:hypothetical protein